MAKPRRRALRGMATLGVASAALMLSAVPASAHDNVIVLGTNWSSITSDHRLLTVCDSEDDGRSVYAEVQPTSWTIATRYHDTYDGAGSCSRYVTYPGFTGRWRLCETPAACSTWHPV
jgi:hypothetical protein